MATITTADVVKLRKETNAGMMDCKNALIEADGNFEKAIDILRKKGQKIAYKRADREAKEGVVIAKISPDNKKAIIIALNCETDFVAKNQDFINFSNLIADAVINYFPATIDELKNIKIDGRSISELITDKMGVIGEKIDLTQYAHIQAELVCVYNHHNKKLSSIVGLNKSSEEIHKVGHELAMQIASMNPLAIDKEDVPKDIIEKEIEVGKELARQEGKPEAILEKIALGRLDKFYKENTLLNQDYIKDNTKTIRQFLSEVDKEVKVLGFKRVGIGV